MIDSPDHPSDPGPRFFVDKEASHDRLAWGPDNRPLPFEKFKELYVKVVRRFNEEASKTYVYDGFVGAFPIHIKSCSMPHIEGAKNQFRDAAISSVLEQINHDDRRIVILHDPLGKISDYGVSFEHETALWIDPIDRKVLIIGAASAGELRNAAFLLCDYIFPEHGLLPLCASATCWEDGSQSSLLLGLSGSGKSTLSTNTNRWLVGDGEILWSRNGLSNLVDASRDKVPEKVFDQKRESEAPKSSVILCADAFGALPAIARLNLAQAQYYFTLGYSAKVMGTEMKAHATFSTCFGASFMPRPTSVYTKLLAELIEKNQSQVWLLNTGWIRGFLNGPRFPLEVSRRILAAIQSGELLHEACQRHPVFGFEVPKNISGVDSNYFAPPDLLASKNLAAKFRAKFREFENTLALNLENEGGPIL